MQRPYLAFGLVTFLALVSVVLLNVTFAEQGDYKVAIIAGIVAGLLSVGGLVRGWRGSRRWRKVIMALIAIPVLLSVADTGRRIPYAFGLFPHGYRFLIPEGYKGYFRVAFGQPKAQPLSVDNSFRLVKVSPSGEATTSDTLLRQNEKVDEFVYEGTGKDAPIMDKWVFDEKASATSYLYVFVGRFEDFRQWQLAGHDKHAYGLPANPSGLGSGWVQDPTHKDPNGSLWRHPSGDTLNSA